MGSTARGLRYPEPTDRLNQVAQFIKDLADDVDADVAPVATRLNTDVTSPAPTWFAATDAGSANQSYVRVVRPSRSLVHVHFRFDCTVAAASGRVFFPTIPAPLRINGVTQLYQHEPLKATGRLNGVDVAGAGSPGLGMIYRWADAVWFLAPWTGLNEVTSPLAVGDYVIGSMTYLAAAADVLPAL